MRVPRHPIVLVGAVSLAASIAPLLAQHTAKQTPPIQLGTSGGSAKDISRFFCCGGTLGSLILRDGTPFILGNNHILARSGGAKSGESDIQPGLVDSNCSAATDNVVGTFPGNFVPLGTANVDVGLSQVIPGQVDAGGAILEVGVPCSAIQAPAVGLAVEKSGRTTGLTTGSIASINTSVQVQYQKGCNKGRKFAEVYTNQVVISPGTFSAGGDSGSLILSNDGTPNPVALLYAGSSSVTIGNPIQDVANSLTAGGHTFSFAGNTCGPAAARGGAIVESLGVRGPTANDLDFARTIKERHEQDLFANPGVLGVGVGADDQDPTQAVVVVYVDTTGGRVTRGLPSELDGLKVKVVATDPFEAR
jgi:hypothetical protein